MQTRGTQFLQMPDASKQRWENDNFKVKEDLEVLKMLKILIGYDKHGYLLQIFTKNVQDRRDETLS